MARLIHLIVITFSDVTGNPQLGVWCVCVYVFTNRQLKTAEVSLDHKFFSLELCCVDLCFNNLRYKMFVVYWPMNSDYMPLLLEQGWATYSTGGPHLQK